MKRTTKNISISKMIKRVNWEKKYTTKPSYVIENKKNKINRKRVKKIQWEEE